MGGVDRGDQHRVMGAGFANVVHFKKWYKKAFLGIADFSMLQAFTAWNLSVDQMRTTQSRGGANRGRKKLLKWEFYAVAAEEMWMKKKLKKVQHFLSLFQKQNTNQK